MVSLPHTQIRFLDLLSAKYPPTVDVRQVSEITRADEQTIRNALAHGRYQIPSFKLGRRRLFRLTDVALHIEQAFAEEQARRSRTPPKRGRPSKLDLLNRQLRSRGDRP